LKEQRGVRSALFPRDNDGISSKGKKSNVDLTDVLQLLHVISGFGLVAGIIGRNVLLWRTRRSDDISSIQNLVDAAGPFDRFMVIPGSFAVLLLGILTWWAQRLPVWQSGFRWVTVSLIAFLTIIPLVPLVFAPRGRKFDAALALAVRDGRVTPELSAALRDPLVAGARTYEVAIISIVIMLMVTKPF
jgi:hypothetical protein